MPVPTRPPTRRGPIAGGAQARVIHPNLRPAALATVDRPARFWLTRPANSDPSRMRPPDGHAALPPPAGPLPSQSVGTRRDRGLLRGSLTPIRVSLKQF